MLTDRPWVQKLRELRDVMGIDQKELSRRLGVSQAAVSKWESGQNEPTARYYSMLTRLAEDQHELYDFFRLKAFEKMSPEAAQAFQDAIAPRPISPVAQLETVEIPLVKDPTPVPIVPSLKPENIVDRVLAPGLMVPHPDFTFAMRARGSEMSPVLESDFIVIVDAFERDGDRLHGAMIAAKDPQRNVRLVWLKRVGDQLILSAQNPISSDLPALYKRDSDWRIIGRVLWWIGIPK